MNNEDNVSSAHGKTWIVWNKSSGSSPLKECGSLKDIQNEAQAISKANPGKSFFIYECVGVVEATVVPSFSKI